MLQLSKFPFKTLKTLPKVSDNRSTSLLLQGGYIRQAMSGAYEFLPMGHRVIQKISEVIREEMDLAWYHEMKMTILTPKEFWEKTGRWDIEDYFKVPGHGGSEYRIAPTNEENVTPIMNEFINSYKDLPTCVYHIQKKFRNEKRAKSWLLRGREFLMKDAYSFHADMENFQEFYEDVKKVYLKIYERLWLWADTVIADADGGAISDQNSHEFQTFLDIGEDIIVTDSWGYCYNLELASGIADDKNIDEAEKDLEYMDTVEDIVNMKKMTAYFEAPDWQMLKTVIYRLTSPNLSWKERDNMDKIKYIWVSLRGDLDISEVKLRQFVQSKYGNQSLSLATEDDLASIWTVRGFISPIKDAGLDVVFYGDDSLKTVKNFFWGANALAKSTKNLNIRDLDIEEYHNFAEPKEWFTSLNIAGEKLQFRKASEVGNIFHLWTKYTKPFWVSYLDADNTMQDQVEMWCYGIWVSRLMGVMAEYFMTEKGINWPDWIAPYDYVVIVIWEQNLEKSIQIGQELESNWQSVILDDRMGRKDGFWQKIWDAELWGIPNKIIISPKTLDQGWYELQIRWEETKIVKL